MVESVLQMQCIYLVVRFKNYFFMTAQTDLILILDALDQLISDPFGRHAWRRLGKLVLKTSDIKILRTVRHRLLMEIDGEGLTGFYRAIFFKYVLLIKNDSSRAGKVLESVRPVHVDRIMSFVNFEWGNILAEAKSSTEFLQMMEAENIPRLIAIVNDIVAERYMGSRTPRFVKNVQRVAIYTPQIFNDKHPPTKMVFEHARLFQSAHLEVRIFSCQEQSILDMKEYLSNDGHLLIPPPETHFDDQVKLTSKVEVVRAQECFSLPLRAQCILKLIEDFDPDVCFFVGHQSLILKSLYRQYPVLGLNVSSSKPIGDLDLWLSADEAAQQSFFSSESNAFYHPFRALQKSEEVKISRSDLELPSDAVVLLTVGARLDKEIVGDWAIAMMEVCQKFSQVIWLIVGGNGSVPRALRDSGLPNIRCLPYQTNLRGFYACSDIYVNPPRLGGGFSVAEAMAEGLATLAFVDTDGGRKLGASASKNQLEYLTELSRLISDAEARSQLGRDLASAFHSKINLEKSVPSLMRAVELTVEKFHGRQDEINRISQLDVS